jgi:prepilin-type processing-associated H-X9-DG protein
MYLVLNVQNGTFGSAGNGTYGTLAAPNAYTQTGIAIYRCPADFGPTLDPYRSNFATSNYRVTCGPNPEENNFFYPDYDWGGCMYQDSKITFQQITDGASNTLIIGECAFDWNPGTNTGRKGALWAGMRGTDSNGIVWISDVMWYLDSETSEINGSAPWAFSSHHPGGAYCLFCDGTVRFVKDGTDVNIIMYLAGRADGKIVSPNDYMQ